MIVKQKRSWATAFSVAAASVVIGGCTADMPSAASASELPSRVNSLAETAQEYENNPWKKVATEDDQNRLYGWADALDSGLAAAKQAGEGSTIEQQGELFEGDAPMENGAIPAGLYNCAITKLGGPDGLLPVVVYPAFRCRVTEDDGRLHFTKLTGSQLTTGWIYRASDRHSVYLGTLFYGYEDKAVPYGETKERDQAAVVQRIGERRWRMVFPYPYYESVVDVMELTPVTD